MPTKTLITSALPYANGPIHLGHLVEYIQTDIYVRFLRSCGEDVIYLCADDTHGTPIELNAAKEGVKPEQFVQRFFEQHQKDFADFEIEFDCFGSTHSEENRHYAELIFERLRAQGQIDRKDIEQAFCEKDQRFLPDRFIRGTCPNCGATNQYGDVCEKCSKAYASTELIDPRCALCGTPPVRRSSAHLFFRLSQQEAFLRDLLRTPGFINTGVANQLQQFFEKGLADWDISRDGPYFGFAIPGETNKFFYVWLDAPIGYISTTEKWAKTTGKAKNALAYWSESSDAKVVHFIGKDIVYFHALFWPAVLKVAGLKRPERIVVHGHLTVNGEKMSKSRGTFINARPYLGVLDPAYLRFFYAANLGPGPEDLDLSLNEFRLRVNADLVNNIGNLANRTLSMIAGPLEGRLAPAGDGPGRKLVEDAIARAAEVRAAFERIDYRAAVKIITEISQSANQFLTVHAPWKKVKTEPEVARRDLSDAAEVAYLIAGMLQPVVPRLSQKLFDQLKARPLSYAGMSSAHYPLLDRTQAIGEPSPLIARLEEDQVSAIVVPEAKPAGAAAVPETSQASAGAGAANLQPSTPPGGATPASAKTQASPGAGAVSVAAPGAGTEPAEIEYADFTRVVLKVGKILSAERIPKADKLLKLSVEIGEPSPRTIAAGIAEAYAPEQLVGRQVVVVTNLKARTIRGVESRGMLLAAGAGGKELSLVDPGPLAPGSEVK